MKRNGSGMGRTAITMMAEQTGSVPDPKVRRPLPVLPLRSEEDKGRDILGLAEDLRGLNSRMDVKSGRTAHSKPKSQRRKIFPRLSIRSDMNADDGETDRGEADGRGSRPSIELL